MAKPALFSLTDVVVARGDRRILDAVTVDVPGDGVTVLWGPSGSGKTTLLRLLNRLDVPDSGTVAHRGRPLDDLDPLDLRRRVGMVFQTPTPFPGTVRHNLLVARPGADDGVLAEVLATVSLDSGLLDRDAATLSGGELQRVCLARTLVTAQEALLLDEPTSALDEEPRRVFEDSTLALAAGGLPTVWVTHDEAQRTRVADHVLTVDDGRVHR